MKKFHFRLQRLLELESKRSEAARRQLALALRRLENAKDVEFSTRKELERVTSQLQRGFAAKKITPFELKLRQDALHIMEKKLSECHELVRREEQHCEKARQFMIEQRRRVVTFERMRERELETWNKSRERWDANVLDEFAARRHQIRMQGAARS
ncbi:MAG: flagellar FliJ family protein [Planctomycetota bacterium]